jgi:hypothetical protein
MTRKPLRDIDPDKFSEQLNSESDRACAVLGVALLDAPWRSSFACPFDRAALSGTIPRLPLPRGQEVEVFRVDEVRAVLGLGDDDVYFRAGRPVVRSDEQPLFVVVQ